MLSLIFRLLFWGMVIAVGTQADFVIFKMRDIMREKALTQISKPWPELPVMPQITREKLKRSEKEAKEKERKYFKRRGK